jgi:hypothetical protein
VVPTNTSSPGTSVDTTGPKNGLEAGFSLIQTRSWTLLDNYLLANAERAEDGSEQVVATVGTRDFAQCMLRLPQLFGG